MDIKEIINKNDIIHIYSQHKKKFLEYLNKYKSDKYLYVSDYDTLYSININNFRYKTNIKSPITGNIIGHMGELDKCSFNSFVYNKIHYEKCSIIFYDFINIKSIYFICNMFLNTRINKNKTILCFSHNLPPEFCENIDVLLNESAF